MIRLVYPTDPNFGDAMSPLIVEKLSGQQVVPSGMWNADMMAVGSVFFRGDCVMGDLASADKLRYVKALVHSLNCRVRTPVMVWGSGFLQYPPFKRPYMKRKLDVYALRGRISHGLCEQFGLMPKGRSIPYGDPGLLFADLFGIKAAPECELGIIPHKYDMKLGWGSRIIEAFRQAGIPIRLIDATNPPIKVVMEIAKCRRIISSSLHGLIVADSLGIPNLHVDLTTLEFSQADYELKFRDYYSAFGDTLPTTVGSEKLLSDPGKFGREGLFHSPSASQINEIKARLLNALPI